jgi:ABC-type branched-subunit amino acid transport system substrate-binding protein
MGPAVETLAKADASAIIMISSTVATSAFAKGYREKGGFAQLYTLSVNSERDIVATVGTQSHGLGISQVFPVPSGGKLPMTRDYLALLKKHAPDAKPSEGSLEGYVYARVLVEAMRRAGAKAGDPAAITKALESAPFDLGGFTVSFAPGQHEGSNYVELTMLNRNGELVR